MSQEGRAGRPRRHVISTQGYTGGKEGPGFAREKKSTEL